MTAWTLDIRDRVAVLTFTRPPLNWMNLQSMTELAEHLEGLAERTDEVTVVLLTGGVDGYFVCHADLDDLALIGAGGMPPGDPRAWRRALALLESIPQPTVAAIDGQAHGGGCEISLACTMRVGSLRAHLAQGEDGMTPPEDLIRIRHLREAAEKAVEFSIGLERSQSVIGTEIGAVSPRRGWTGRRR